MEVKVECACGTRYKFDIEPVNGRMPTPVQCPACGADGTGAANEFIGRKLPTASAASQSPVQPPPAPGLRVAGAAGRSVSAPAEQAAATVAHAHDQADRTLLERTTFFVKERVGLLKLTD